MNIEFALWMFPALMLLIFLGFPVAFSLGGTALIFAAVGVLGGGFNEALLSGLPNRVFGIMANETLVAVPLFVFMGVMLERSRVAESLLATPFDHLHRIRLDAGRTERLVGFVRRFLGAVVDQEQLEARGQRDQTGVGVDEDGVEQGPQARSSHPQAARRRSSSNAGSRSCR